jgi:ribulose-5-phosphate 4-epimerase/fuculose-1-phosphate aldolase
MRSPSSTELADEVAIVRRVGRRLRLIDVDGHVSAKTEDGASILVTPGRGIPTPRQTRTEDLLEVSLDDGRVTVGDQHRLPSGVALDLAILREHPEVHAVVVGAPWAASAFGAVGRDVLPLTHTWAEFAHEGAAWLNYADATSGADDIVRSAARDIGSRRFVHVPGFSVMALADSPLDGLRRLDAFEYLARLTDLTTQLNPSPSVVTKEQAQSIHAQRPAEAVPSRDYRRYYRSLDGHLGPTPEQRWPTDDAEGHVRRDVAVACRLLAAAGDLVAFFEHVSHRIPGRDDRFAMSPAKDFAQMTPDDIGIVSMADDCPPISGPLPPAPFRWYHRDLLERRPDVHAVVHTHELAGRAFVLAGATAPAIHRSALLGVGGMPPTFPEASLVFSKEHREAVLARLGDGPWVHAFAHGTDFVASDLATATVRAINTDLHLRFTAYARRLGSAREIESSDLDLARRFAIPLAMHWNDLIDDLDG